AEGCHRDILPASTAADLTLERHKFTENIHTLGSPSCKHRASQYPSADSERTARHGQCRGRIAVAQSVGRQKNLAAQWQSWSRMISLWPAAGRPVSVNDELPVINRFIFVTVRASAVFFTASTGMWKVREDFFVRRLTSEGVVVRLQMVRDFLKV